MTRLWDAKAVLFLALDSSNLINGTGINVDGGASLKM